MIGWTKNKACVLESVFINDKHVKNKSLFYLEWWQVKGLKLRQTWAFSQTGFWGFPGSPAAGRCGETLPFGRLALCRYCCSGDECGESWKPFLLWLGKQCHKSFPLKPQLFVYCLETSPSSKFSPETASGGVVSKLRVPLRSDWEELDEARGRRLRKKKQEKQKYQHFY